MANGNELGGPAAGSSRPGYEGRSGEIGRLALIIGLLNLVTLGFYRFWGKTRLRHYIWSRLSFEGEPLEYTGRGGELFKGFLIALTILIPFGVAYAILDFYLAGISEIAQSIASLVYILAFAYLFNVAVYRARRYRLSRTVWRGIRAGQTGSSWSYALKAIGWSLISIITLGLALPVHHTRLQNIRSGNTWFGNLQVEFRGEAGKLFKRWLVCWLLIIPTLGLSYLHYWAREFRYFTESTSLADLRFDSDLRARDLAWIYLPYLLVMIVAVAVLGAGISGMVGGGLAGMSEMSNAGTVSPAFVLGIVVWFLLFMLVMGVISTMMVTNRLAGLFSCGIAVSGVMDYDAVAQSSRSSPAHGEGLADALDVGGI